MYTTGAPWVVEGKLLYYDHCVGCHGVVVVSGGGTPELRYSTMLANDGWYAVVLDGVLESSGMIGFSARLSREEVTAIREFVIAKANADWEVAAAPQGPAP